MGPTIYILCCEIGYGWFNCSESGAEGGHLYAWKSWNSGQSQFTGKGSPCKRTTHVLKQKRFIQKINEDTISKDTECLLTKFISKQAKV